MMDGFWDLDFKTAISTIEELKLCVEALARKNEGEDRQKYGTIIRAKLSSLRKTIGKLEHTLRDIAKGGLPSNVIEEKTRELDSIKRSHERLEEAMGYHSSYTSLPDSQQIVPKAQLEQMSREDLYDYRNSIIRAQDRELDVLDTTAGAIKNISTHIRDEVDLHSNLLGDLESAMDSTHSIVSQNRATFTQIIERSSKRRLTIYIVILTIILLLILLF